MNLHDHFADTFDRVDETGPDLARLTATARRRGTTARRRRTALLTAAASITVLALTGGVVAAVSGSEGNGPSFAADPVTPDLGGPTEPTTGQGAALALQWAVDQQRDGRASELAGQLSGTSGDYYVEMRWDDADGLGGSVVGLNVQHGRGMHVTCDESAYPACSQTRLPGGSQLTTYEDRTSGGLRLVVDLLRPDRIRLVAAATNGFEAPGDGGGWDQTRSTPPLSLADLETIARLPIWGDTLPASFVDAGETLNGYRDFDRDGGWIHDPATDG